MQVLPDSLETLIQEFSRLPGIGRRTAQRLALSLVKSDTSQARKLADALTAASDRIVRCDTCFGFSESPTCAICLSPRRDRDIVCVVEFATDILLIEGSSDFSGLYHVLGGALSPVDGISPDDLTLRELITRVEADSVTEVIVATSPTMQGEATASYIADMLGDTTEVSRLASGLPVGVDLSHTDEATISRAFSGRRKVM